MRILITTGLFPPDIGGPATQIERLAADLSQSGFEVTVLTYGSPAKKFRVFELFCVSRCWPMGLRQLFYGLKTFWLARQAEIIYTTDLYSPGLYSKAAAKFWRKKFVVRFAGDSAWESAQNKKLTQDDIVVFQDKIYGAEIERKKRQRGKILKSADAIVAVSHFMKELAIKIGVRAEKIYVIYNAVDFFADSPRWQAPTRPILVYSGRLTPWKGTRMLIHVVAMLKQKYPDIKLEILGEGPEKDSLRLEVKNLGLEDNVNFVGCVSEEESHKIFSRSTIFVLNTNYEGFSHAILNAMNVGVPVITTPSGGNPEIVQDGENGLLAPYNDESAWQKAIDKLLSDNNLQENFSVNGKKTTEKFKWEELIKKTKKVFHDFYREGNE